MTDQTILNRRFALASFLSIKITDVEETSLTLNTFEAEGQDWLVLTDEEADEACKADIKENVWAFRAEFLSAHIPSLDAEMIGRMQEAMDEDANAALLALITDFDHFVKDAVMCDGRGHFLAGYDSEEQESEGLYLYRTN